MTTQAPPPNVAIVTPASAHPQLDLEVEAFLDHYHEAAASSAEHNAVTYIRPHGSSSALLPVLLYLYASNHEALTRNAAMQDLADRSGIKIVLLPLSTETFEEAEIEIIATFGRLALDGTFENLDLTRLALGGDGMGALVAVAFASLPTSRRFQFSLLVLATPLLSPPVLDNGNSWLSTSRAQACAQRAAAMIKGDEWPRDYPRERLHRLPFTLVLTADSDPFRDGGEDFALRLMAAEGDVMATRAIGTIHDYTWLPPLLGTAATISAQHLIAATLREHLFVQNAARETRPC